MLLNCDLGESYGARRVGQDAAIMPHIHQANIACGFHGGDPLTIAQTLELAREHGVSVGAHPAYPDLEGFGRRSMALPEPELIAALHYQIAALEGMALSCGLTLVHVKAHGALYNDMLAKPAVRASVLRAVACYHRPLTLVLQATGNAAEHREEARAAGVKVQMEAFADRRYRADGSLQPRDQPGAVLDAAEMQVQASRLCSEGQVLTVEGSLLQLDAETLCVHGDNPASVSAVRALRALIDAG